MGFGMLLIRTEAHEDLKLRLRLGGHPVALECRDVGWKHVREHTQHNKSYNQPGSDGEADDDGVADECPARCAGGHTITACRDVVDRLRRVGRAFAQLAERAAKIRSAVRDVTGAAEAA